MLRPKTYAVDATSETLNIIYETIMNAQAGSTAAAETHQIVSNCLQQLERLLGRQDEGSYARILAMAGLNLETISTSALSLTQLDQILVHARSLQPGVTLELFSALSLTDLGLVGYAAASADTVGDAFEIVNRYHALTSDRYWPVMETGGDSAHIRAAANPGFIHQLTDIAEDHLAGSWTLLRLLLGGQADPDQIAVRLAYQQPAYHRLYTNAFGPNVYFDTDTTELCFPSDWLALPVASSDRNVAHLSAVICERILGPVSGHTTTADAVRALLLTRRGRTVPDVATAARALNLSTDQFRKRLWRQGCSYKALVLETRMVLAKNYLLSTSLGIQEIAYLLDYSNPGAFSRAFKNFYGMAPLFMRGDDQGKPSA